MEETEEKNTLPTLDKELPQQFYFLLKQRKILGTNNKTRIFLLSLYCKVNSIIILKKKKKNISKIVVFPERLNQPTWIQHGHLHHYIHYHFAQIHQHSGTSGSLVRLSERYYKQTDRPTDKHVLQVYEKKKPCRSQAEVKKKKKKQSSQQFVFYK